MCVYGHLIDPNFCTEFG